MTTQAPESATPPRSLPTFRLASAPVFAVAVAFAVGIVGDRYGAMQFTHWLALALGLLLIWVAAFTLRRDRAASILILSLWATLGGGAHHNTWSIAGRDDILRRASESPSPIEFIGVIASRPSVRPADEASTSVLPPVDRTQCEVRVQQVLQRGESIATSGLVQLIVSGHLATSNSGDTIRARGQISRPQAPGNPGEFDYREFLRRKQIHCVVRISDPEAVETLRRVDWTSLQWWKNRARHIAGDILYSSLEPDVYPIAAAILLGDRDYITTDIREAFTESGTMHLLAISGLHVGILALFLWRVARLLRFRLSMEVTTVLAVVGLYVTVTDVRPSVLRAGVLVACLMCSRLWVRRASAPNSLGIAALLVLAINPTDLFNVGAQLSFLAVAAISWAMSTGAAIRIEEDALDSRRARYAKWIGRAILRDFRVMFYVTVITSPLVAHAFHLYAPIGLAINVALIHLVFCVMIAGYSLLAVGYFVPAFAVVPATLFSAGLRLLQFVAELASSVSLGHRYGPGPSVFWVLVFYLVFAASMATRRRRTRHRLICAMLLWVTFGLSSDLVRDEPGCLRCTFLDVGHGSSILIESPEGRTLLVDVGSMDSSTRATKAVQGCLWERGYSHIDTLAITHADLDHFNGTAKLLEDTLVGNIIVPRAFIDSTEPGARDVRELAKESGTPLIAVQRGQPLRMGVGVTVTVLHPGESATQQFEDDNASSLVLLIEYANRRILLTGDVSGSGQRALLAKTIPEVHVFLSPHHGSQHDNTTELQQWARPGIVVASTRHRGASKVLNSVYPAANAYVTATDGAVTCTIRSTGELSVETYRSRRSSVFKQ